MNTVLLVALLDLHQFPPPQVVEQQIDFLQSHLDWIRARKQWDRIHQWELGEWERETLRVWHTWYLLEDALSAWYAEDYRLKQLMELKKQLGPDYNTGTMPWISLNHFQPID